MVIYIVRHGQTEENMQRILQGHMPGTLTEQGKEQVKKAADALDDIRSRFHSETEKELASRGVEFKCIVSSDLKRAMDSAQIISERLNVPVVPMEILRERNWGSYTGMSLSEAKDKYYHEGTWDFPITDNPAETEEEIVARASKALELLSQQYKDDNIIVVTHGQFARTMIAANFDCSYHEVATFVNAEIRMLNI